MKSILILFIFIILFSCKFEDNEFPSLSTIKDERLVATVKKYVNDEHINIKSSFISVECIYQINKTVYTISASKNNQGYQLSPPDYFSLIGDIVVLLRVTNNETVEQKKIASEIDYLIKEKEIVLEARVTYYDPPVWTLVKCGGNYELITRLTDTIQEVTPCGNVSEKLMDH